MQRLLTATMAFLALATACGRDGTQTPAGDASLKGLSASAGAKNIALVFGAANGLPGIDKDLAHMKRMFEDPSGRYNFEVVSKMGATASDVLATVKQYAPLVGDGGTLAFYFSGHGGGGTLLAENHTSLRFTSVSAAIKEVRSTPLRRFLVFIDTCNNGNLAGEGGINLRSETTDVAGLDVSLGLGEADAAAMADAIVAELPQHAPKDGSAPGAYASDKLYQELFVITSSTESESSNAGSDGSAFTVALADAFSELKAKPESTIRQLAQSAKQKTIRTGGHTPVFRGVPDAMLDEKMLNSPDGGGSLPPVSTSALLLALGQPDATGAAPLFGAAPQAVSRFALCHDALETCRGSRREDVAFDALPPSAARPGLTVFRARAVYTPDAARAVTLLGFDAQGNVIDARAIRFTAR
jgi:hypothetical protein